MSKKKKVIKIIIKNNLNNEYYTFVNDNILNLKNNENKLLLENKKTIGNEQIEKKKIHSKKVDNKGRKIIGNSLQGHSPVYE
ncbi:MAG TPA: hypothetical protein VFV86_01935 [Nitrososphaeraceae archaeon]|nr:hypothetical protein [Nitrososphaeraceae archaeon]